MFIATLFMKKKNLKRVEKNSTLIRAESMYKEVREISGPSVD